MEDETTTDGCGPSKAAQEDVIFEDLTSSISSSQPATQPLGGVQDPESEEEEEEDPETVSWNCLTGSDHYFMLSFNIFRMDFFYIFYCLESKMKFNHYHVISRQLK